MNTQDRAVVKALLQYMTNKCLTGSAEFRAALNHFNITTTYEHTTCHLDGDDEHMVDIFSPGAASGSQRYTFNTRQEAKSYAMDARTLGDEPELAAAPIDHAAAARAIIARAIHVGANSFGHVIGEHEELVEDLRISGFTDAADKVDAIEFFGANHKEIRALWLEALRQVSATI